jgi:hypothetical protein
MTTREWLGWFRPQGGAWELILARDTEAECWGELIAYKPVLVPRCDKCVLPRARVP